MVTLFGIICVFILMVGILMILSGVIAISPAILLIIALPLLDFIVLKAIFGTKKKSKKEE
jgi:hypothetical protein